MGSLKAIEIKRNDACQFPFHTAFIFFFLKNIGTANRQLSSERSNRCRLKLQFGPRDVLFLFVSTTRDAIWGASSAAHNTAIKRRISWKFIRLLLHTRWQSRPQRHRLLPVHTYAARFVNPRHLAAPSWQPGRSAFPARRATAGTRGVLRRVATGAGAPPLSLVS